jgi:DNA mismatch repair protein MSH6
MLTAVGTRKRICFPTLSETSLEITDIYHPGLEAGRRIYNSIMIGEQDCRKHVLLTGPNRGGKSTLLKSLGAAVLMSQTLGVVFARKARMPVFGSIVTALNPTDTLGALSLFEAEIEFAKDVKATIATSTQPVFLMMDEIFHGTNAHDGVEASQVFLDQLYSAGGATVFSVVSTHYMDLPNRYGEKHTQNLCMDARVDPEDSDRLIYSYRLIPGVNQYSSVREILRERGLLDPGCGVGDQKSSQPASKV